MNELGKLLDLVIFFSLFKFAEYMDAIPWFFATALYLLLIWNNRLMDEILAIRIKTGSL